MKKGTKFDTGKPRWSLLPFFEVEEIVDVLTQGAVKYADDNWMSVKPGKDRYFSAMMRHISAWKNGERVDPESGRSHLAHAGCCLLFIMWFDNHPEEQK
ncbi:MAG: hypothetical protein JRL30_20285 [Deltaproteobacteria bacterium]|nr:hypothetical protein [Deltaproteobacteria bacterium]